ncbi:C-type lectin domain family 4 member G-like [Crotalus adamanteus]|uniref:C-type lectin domain family 4 member G-like n=1 Tax=Crotalus adamanteus TaxID=8729 RepID=A0AAW1BXK5_CROAD
MEAQMQVFGSNLDNSERNYQNVVPPNRTRAMKSKSGASSFVHIANHTGCISSRASKIVLYILVCVSLLMATAAFLVAFLKFIPQCPKGWLKFQANCYYFSTDQQPWEKAMSNCQSLKAHLVVVDDKNDTDKQVWEGKAGLKVKYQEELIVASCWAALGLEGEESKATCAQVKSAPAQLLAVRHAHCRAPFHLLSYAKYVSPSSSSGSSKEREVPKDQLSSCQGFLDHLKNSSYWIGLRRHPKDKWMWINGKSFQEATQSIENNKKEDCMYNLWKDSKSRKKKTACTEHFPYICEKEQT